ncbi:MAG: hypothetical protein AABZ60_24440 [Planctomycetota bacterium]
MRNCYGLVLVILISFLFLALSAQEWEKLGSCRANFQGDHDVITVTHEGKFVAIKFDVEDARLEMYNVKITFGNGEIFSPETQLVFSKESRSRTIDLPGESRVIKKVEFFYRTMKNKRQEHADLDLFGKRSEEKKEQWEKLGTRRVDFQSEKDTIAVATQEGTFNALRLEVEEGALEMFDVRVHFANGEMFSPETRFYFKEDTRTVVIDLPGNKRFIEKVVFFYRSEVKRAPAIIHLFGRKNETEETKAPQYEGWELADSRIVDFQLERDKISIDKGKISAIRVAVEGGDLEMYDIVVTFGNGDKVSPPTRLTFDENTRSRDIDLPGKQRNIQEISFLYRSLHPKKEGRATVYIFIKR